MMKMRWLKVKKVRKTESKMKYKMVIDKLFRLI